MSETTATADGERTTRQQWRWAVLASLADYLDAGGIVAVSAGLAVWSKAYHLDAGTVGVLGAVGANALSYAVGALIGGRLGDLLGRKRIYQWDLLVYALGVTVMIFNQNLGMLIAGSVIMGLAIGADVPTSWALIGELAPKKSRGRLMGLTSVFWSLGPVVTLLLALAFSGIGVLGIRLVFAHLLIVALVTWFLRRGMVESQAWTKSQGVARGSGAAPPVDAPVPRNPFAASSLRLLLTKKNLGALVFIFGVHMLGSITGGAFGAFLPYILRTSGSQSQATSVGLQALNFAISALVTAFIFMPLIDRVNRRVLYTIGTLFVLVSLIVFLAFPLTFSTALVGIVLFAIGGGCWQEQFYRVWSQEMFPTAIRTTAQGLVIAVQKGLLAIWALYVPVIAATGFHHLALVFAISTAAALVIGVAFMPRTHGQSLEEIDADRGAPEPVATG